MPNIIQRKVMSVPMEELHFDYRNPRLAMEWDELSTGSDRDVQMIETLDEEADIGELITSILQNGYIPVEPLIVIKSQDKIYRVLEGNRRLAAMRLIKDSSLAKECGIKIDSTQVVDDILRSFVTVPVYQVDTEEEAHALIGFKHIKGPYKWGSYAKAKFVTKQYLVSKTSIEDIAQSIGDAHNTVRKLIGSMLVLEQAIAANLFEINDRAKVGPFGFSHLYTALEKAEYRDFIGLSRDWNKAPTSAPVPEENFSELKEVLGYLYGVKSENKPSLIKSQNPDLSNLGRTIANKDGLNDLRAGLSLDIAYDNVRPDDEFFNEIIRKTLAQVNAAMAATTRYDGEDDEIVRIAKKISQGASALLGSVEMINTKNKKE
ncbi:ParB N-terminal domain-containing protein [Paremcibacter congregatus]|uniref:Chromosome partitioning protein ParB n=1 Tax=Paremcibacter congregatus TaxID=2043170 RepID=A0A2G4YWV5_9PROT|nr:ParB N-terminal domain-containing protein [Paremcibacter congregatus]PHZ86723.1 chromosome partitioning protein ParB [Paremcibacter congregatus]QDE27617.1 chromosome partitioning protein ParB [Paremcibacter congregatus]